MSDIKKIKDEFLLKLKENLDLNQVNQIKTELFGKTGLISSQFKQLGKLAEDERKKFASDLNLVKNELEDLITTKINDIETKEINKKLEKEKIDVTLPERPFIQGKIHPVSQVIDEISSIFSGWLSGVFNAVKLLYSFSTSGPSSTLKPISEKIEEISSMT